MNTIIGFILFLIADHVFSNCESQLSQTLKELNKCQNEESEIGNQIVTYNKTLIDAKCRCRVSCPSAERTVVQNQLRHLNQLQRVRNEEASNLLKLEVNRQRVVPMEFHNTGNKSNFQSTSYNTSTILPKQNNLKSRISIISITNNENKPQSTPTLTVNRTNLSALMNNSKPAPNLLQLLRPAAVMGEKINNFNDDRRALSTSRCQFHFSF